MNQRQELFCFEYAHSLNATEAAIKAGYAETSAYSIGHENLRKPEIQCRITELLDERRAEQQRRFINAADAAIATLESIMADAAATPSARVAAANSLLDRGGHAVINKSLIKAKVNVNELTNEQRAERISYLLGQARSRRADADTDGDA
ncbi:terminase small subunit [Acidithiobacillus albertensis]|uniref:terminase small subunit n=1 Tax=Acidithiobacillus albertensis TaxID=119978 RepID=UPI001C07CF9B|nr:terminase small subunit [Acidithiobacillus albertensis]MBU2741285.1 terminase small subunit [Acidithiobacillus albertensis]